MASTEIRITAQDAYDLEDLIYSQGLIDSGKAKTSAAIQEVEDQSHADSSSLTPLQVSTCVNHILYALSYVCSRSDTTPNWAEHYRGAIEIVRGAGMFVGLRAPEYHPSLTRLGALLWEGNIPVTSIFKVALERDCLGGSRPESTVLYRSLGVRAFARDPRAWKLDRAAGREIQRDSDPNSEPVTAQTKIGRYLTALDISNWLIDSPVFKWSYVL